MKTLKSFPRGATGSCLFLMAAAVLLTATPSKAAPWGTTDASLFSCFQFTENRTALELGSNPGTGSNDSSSGGNLGITGSAHLTLSNFDLTGGLAHSDISGIVLASQNSVAVWHDSHLVHEEVFHGGQEHDDHSDGHDFHDHDHDHDHDHPEIESEDD